MNDIDRQDLQELLDQVDTGDVGSLAVILEKYPAAVQVVRHDRVILVLDSCADEPLREAYGSTIQLTNDQILSFGSLLPVS